MNKWLTLSFVMCLSLPGFSYNDLNCQVSVNGKSVYSVDSSPSQVFGRSSSTKTLFSAENVKVNLVYIQDGKLQLQAQVKDDEGMNYKILGQVIERSMGSDTQLQATFPKSSLFNKSIRINANCKNEYGD